MKSLHNTTANAARKNVEDLQTWGDADSFRLICKASSESEGWMKSTKALEIPGVGCLVQVTTQQRNADGSYAVAEAVTFVPGVEIHHHTVQGETPSELIVTSRRLIPIGQAPGKTLDG
jgi:hypothetical protein